MRGHFETVGEVVEEINEIYRVTKEIENASSLNESTLTLSDDTAGTILDLLESYRIVLRRLKLEQVH